MKRRREPRPVSTPKPEGDADDIEKRLRERREANAKALAKFGAAVPRAGGAALERVVRSGKSTSPVVLHTIGYEKRSPEDLLAALRGARVRVVVDVRDDPMSRRAAYRPEALKELLEPAGIAYEARRDLGAPKDLRDELGESGDLEAYLEAFRKRAEETLAGEPLARLEKRVAAGGAALLCYERRPEECHRSVLADLVGERLDATVIAIL